MLIDEIYAMECRNESSIHLVRDRKFFQAYEKSAFRFVKFLREYKVHHKFVKKIGADVVYLGFPDSVLENLKKETLDAGYEWKTVSEDLHIEICGLPKLEYYNKWRSDIVQEKVDFLVVSQKESSEIPQKKLFVFYREFYDFTLYLCGLTSKFHRNFKFGLGDKLREECVACLTDLQCTVQQKKTFERSVFDKFLVSLQIRLRLLMDLKQVSEKQWVFVNQTLVKLQKMLGQNSANQGLPERTLLESHSPLV